MPHILAIDTSTDACSVAVLTPTEVKQQLSIAAREHTQRLLPSVESLLAEMGLSLNQFDAIAFGVGPGSFTGLRIALSTAQGLAYGADLPLIPVSTLMTMAQTAFRHGKVPVGHTIVPMIDARMNEVYWSAYQVNEHDSLVEALQEEVIAAPDDVVADERFLSYLPHVTAVGSGWGYDVLSNTLSTHSSSENHVKSPELTCYPEAHDLAVLAQRAMAQQGDAAMVSPLSAVPTYMRNEISWKKRQRIREVSS